MTWLATVITWLRPLVGHMHKCHAAMLRRGANGGRVSARVQSGAAWAARLLQRTEGAFSITDFHRTGTFNQGTLMWEGDSKCITIWGDANHCKSSRFGRAWLVASAGVGQIGQGFFLSEKWKDEDEDLFVAESGEDAASRRELFNYLQAVWEVHKETGCVRFCVVGDCAPACICREGGAPSSERKIFQSWFEDHPAAETASWLVNEAVGYLECGLAYNTSRSYTSGVNRLKAFAETFAFDTWAIRWWEPDPALLILFMTYVIGQISLTDRLTLCGITMSKDAGGALSQLAAGSLSPRAKHDLIVLCTIMVWGVFGLFRIGELVISGPKRYARVLRRSHCALAEDGGETFLHINLDGSKTDPFRGGVDVWLANLSCMMLSPVFWFHRLESSALSVGLNRGKAQPMFRWADGISVERTRFVADARTLLARAGVDDGTRFNGISLRRGGAKSLKLAGASDIAIMRAGRWSSDCFRRYIETPRDEILQE
eukprot:g53807.t1